MLMRMRRARWPLLCSLLALSACNALTGAADLSTCPTCEDGAEVDSGATLDAAPRETSVLDASSSDARDAAGPAIDASKDAAKDAEAGIGCEGAAACVRVMFVTSTASTGNLGGIAGADAKCQALADNSPVARIKGRTFLAWVSTTASPVTTRMTHGTMAYIRPDNATIASSWADLVDGSLQNGISVNDLGAAHSGPGAGTGAVWTATASSGAGYTGQSCLDWTSSLTGLRGDRGNLGGAGSGWSSSSSDDCSTQDNLYCVEK